LDFIVSSPWWLMKVEPASGKRPRPRDYSMPGRRFANRP
jgi:hypothetical protein